MKSFRLTGKNGNTATKAGYILLLISMIITGIVSWFAPRFGFESNYFCALFGFAFFGVGTFFCKIMNIDIWK